MLVLVSTPIGNLKDISLRAIETLKSADLILCEDTRISIRLLQAYDIHKQLVSFHKFNEREKENQIIEKLQEGAIIALITDAGTPGISDPGAKLVKRCQEEGIKVSAVPGASALIMALSLYGTEEKRFQFIGFMEKKEGDLRNQLIDMLFYDGISIAYETPHHLAKTLETLSMISPTSEIFIARELTKIYEESIRDTPGNLLTYFEQKPVKGELVLIIEGNKKIKKTEEMSPREYVDFLKEIFHLHEKEAIKLAANYLEIPKRKLYDDLHRNSPKS